MRHHFFSLNFSPGMLPPHIILPLVARQPYLRRSLQGSVEGPLASAIANGIYNRPFLHLPSLMSVFSQVFSRDCQDTYIYKLDLVKKVAILHTVKIQTQALTHSPKLAIRIQVNKDFSLHGKFNLISNLKMHYIFTNNSFSWFPPFCNNVLSKQLNIGS